MMRNSQKIKQIYKNDNILKQFSPMHHTFLVNSVFQIGTNISADLVQQMKSDGRVSRCFTFVKKHMTHVIL